jgi:hypothetical protein
LACSRSTFPTRDIRRKLNLPKARGPRNKANLLKRGNARATSTVRGRANHRSRSIRQGRPSPSRHRQNGRCCFTLWSEARSPEPTPKASGFGPGARGPGPGAPGPGPEALGIWGPWRLPDPVTDPELAWCGALVGSGPGPGFFGWVHRAPLHLVRGTPHALAGLRCGTDWARLSSIARRVLCSIVPDWRDCNLHL